MTKRIACLALLLLVLPTLAAHAVTLHMAMTPELIGEGGFEMKEIGNGRTLFTIRRSTTEDPRQDSRFPFVRRGRLDVFGEEGLITRCQIEPSKDNQGTLVYRFEIHQSHASLSSFTIVESIDNQQVGGGKIFSYSLIDFIDPQHRWKEIVSRLEVPKIPEMGFKTIADPE